MIEDKTSLKTTSPQTKRQFTNRYIEEIEPSVKKEFVTYRQTTDIWTNKGYRTVAIRYGDVASRSVTRDIARIVEENKALPKVPHDDTEEKLDRARRHRKK